MHSLRPNVVRICRRSWLRTCGCGFGSVALTALLRDWCEGNDVVASPWQPKAPHFAPCARNVIFLYMDGGPSQVDTFDYKPLLAKYDGQDPHRAIGKLEPTQFNNVGNVMRSPWQFRRVGESGNWVSELFPQLQQ